LIVFIDNTVSPQKVATIKKGKIVFKLEKLPEWILENFSSIFSKETKKALRQQSRSATSIDEVKLLYSKIKNKKG
jgi:hypothetical protein